MRGAVLHGFKDIRVEDRVDPVIEVPTDAIVRTVAACVCGSDLWRFRDEASIDPRPIGHEYVGVVEEIGAEVTGLKVGQFVVGGFLTSDNTCPHCSVGMQANCQVVTGYNGCQAEYIRVQNAAGTLVATPEQPDQALIPSLLTLSDVMCTGWHAAVSAGVRLGSTVVVVGDGAVGLCGVLAAAEMGAERIIAMSRHADRQALAREFCATDIVSARGEEGVAAVMELTGGVGADAVLECVGTDESVNQALASCRPGGMVGWVGLPHLSEFPTPMFWRNVGLRGGPAPARAYLEDLLGRVLAGSIDPGKVFDLTLPLEQAADAYAAMDERRAIKAMLLP